MRGGLALRGREVAEEVVEMGFGAIGTVGEVGVGHAAILRVSGWVLGGGCASHAGLRGGVPGLAWGLAWGENPFEDSSRKTVAPDSVWFLYGIMSP